jgi:hypothetical protein
MYKFISDYHSYLALSPSELAKLVRKIPKKEFNLSHKVRSETLKDLKKYSPDDLDQIIL